MSSPDVKKLIDDIVAEHKIVVFSKSYCPYCKKAKQALYKLIDSAKVFVLEIENRPDMNSLQDELASRTGARSVPRVFVDGECIGGGDETARLAGSGELRKMFESKGIV